MLFVNIFSMLNDCYKEILIAYVPEAEKGLQLDITFNMETRHLTFYHCCLSEVHIVFENLLTSCADSRHLEFFLLLSTIYLLILNDAILSFLQFLKSIISDFFSKITLRLRLVIRMLSTEHTTKNRSPGSPATNRNSTVWLRDLSGSREAS